ncbi:hypothetical protein [Coleofasciculus sp.]|uniref:hypothetical protein n=1 Tax=Coleofasciculus sp. TaxID=3100458 RepID=UPI003A2B9306
MKKNDIGVILIGLAMITATLVYFDRASNLEVKIALNIPSNLLSRIQNPIQTGL